MADAAANWSPFGEGGKALPMTRAGTTVSIAEAPATFVLQGDCRDGAFLKAAREKLGIELPLQVGDVGLSKAERVFWLGPDMWLVLAPGDAAVETLQRLIVLTTRFLHASVVETTETRAWIRLAGPAARQVLMRLTARDLRDTAFAKGACVGALLGPLHVLLERIDDDAYMIAGPVSSAEFLVEMVRDALGFV